MGDSNSKNVTKYVSLSVQKIQEATEQSSPDGLHVIALQCVKTRVYFSEVLTNTTVVAWMNLTLNGDPKAVGKCLRTLSLSSVDHNTITSLTNWKLLFNTNSMSFVGIVCTQAYLSENTDYLFGRDIMFTYIRWCNHILTVLPKQSVFNSNRGMKKHVPKY